MKALILFLTLIFGGIGCANKPSKSEIVKPPSITEVKNDIKEAQIAIDEANKAAERALWSIKNSKDYNKRIENKAIVILEYWNSAK